MRTTVLKRRFKRLPSPFSYRWMEKANMKKAFLYVSLAIVLGVVVMLFPLWTYFRSVNEEGPIGFTDSMPYFKPMTASENLPEYMRTKTEAIPAYGGSNVKAQPTDASLQILAIGFIVAMVVYVIVRRRVSRPTVLEMYRFPRA